MGVVRGAVQSAVRTRRKGVLNLSWTCGLRRSRMNRYGQLAMRHWEQHGPSRVAAMADREGFFTDLGVQVEAGSWS